MRFEKRPAAVLQDDGELQFAIARIGADDFADVVERALAVLALVDADNDPRGVARAELVERDQLVDDEIGFLAAAAVDRTAD